MKNSKRFLCFFITLCFLLAGCSDPSVEKNDHKTTTKLLIKMPTRERPDRFFANLDSYYRHLSGSVPFHFHISCDVDDVSMNNEEVRNKLSNYPHLTVHYSPNRSKVEAYNEGLKEYNFDILLAVSDDKVPWIGEFDKKIVDQMETHFPNYDGVINYHDGNVGAQCITIPVVGKKYYDRFGYLYHPSYRSLFANQELTEVAKAIGKEFVCNDVIIRHNHPVYNLAPWDNLYYRIETDKIEDSKTFAERKKRNFDLSETEIATLKQHSESIQKPKGENKVDHYYCTAADENHFNNVISLIASIHKVDFDHLDEIAVFDLGLTEDQKFLINSIQKTKVYPIEPIRPDLFTYFVTNSAGRIIRGWFAWKPVIFKQALDMYPYFLYLDSGTLVLNSPDNLFTHIKQNDYYLMSIYPCNIEPVITKPVKDRVITQFSKEQQDYILNPETPMVDGGFQGLSRAMYDSYVLPVYKHTGDLTLFADDGSAKNGFGSARHDQTLLSVYVQANRYPLNSQGWTLLKVDGREVPFHIHWDRSEINPSTTIYRCRADHRYAGDNTPHIRWRPINGSKG